MPNLTHVAIKCILIPGLLFGQQVQAALITNPDDPRNWQGASVGTFANFFYGSNTLANRQLVVDNKLLDDGIFDPTGYTPASLILGGANPGRSLDLTGTGNYDYVTPEGDVTTAAGAIDDKWFQTGSLPGETIFDLGFQATKAAIFNTIDHGPLPQEAIESTIYLSNDKLTWTQAVTERVWLEGFQPNLGILWDGFSYVVGTGTSDTFRYASVTWGGPGALQSDGDNEINGILGTKADLTPYAPGTAVPGPLPLLGVGAAFGYSRRLRKRINTSKNLK